MPSSDIGVRDGDVPIVDEKGNGDPPSCKRCGEQYVVECGYEPSKHGFCWPCCDEIVEKLIELQADPTFIHAMIDPHHNAERLLGRGAGIRVILGHFLKRGTAPRE